MWNATSNGTSDSLNFSFNSPYFLTTLSSVTGLIPRQLSMEGNYYLTVFGLIPDTYTLTLTLAGCERTCPLVPSLLSTRLEMSSLAPSPHLQCTTE